MKLCHAAIQLAAYDEDWPQILNIFSKHFSKPSIASICPVPKIYRRSAREYLYFVPDWKRRLAIVYIRSGGREYRFDYSGMYSLDTPCLNAPDMFQIVFAE